jgi:hypothetical protein
MPERGGEVRANPVTCVTQGHLWGPQGRCVMCGAWRGEQAMDAHSNRVQDEMPWRQTVRDLYDMLHFGEGGNIFSEGEAGRLAEGLVALIEERHPAFFGAERKAP